MINLDRLLHGLRIANRRIAVIIGIGLLGCAAFVVLDIFARQAGSSFGGTDEISGYAMAIATSWGMGFALLELGHVRIDLLRSQMRQRGRVLLDLFSLAVLAATVTLIATRCWPVVERSLVNGSRANTPLETPLWMVQLPWFGGWVWFGLMAWITLLAAGCLAATGRFDAAEDAAGVFSEAETPS